MGPAHNRRRTDRATGWHVEGSRGSERRRFRPSRSRKFWLIFACALAVNWYFFSTASREPQPVDVPYSFFREQASANNVASVIARGRSLEVTFRRPTEVPKGLRAEETVQ